MYPFIQCVRFIDWIHVYTVNFFVLFSWVRMCFFCRCAEMAYLNFPYVFPCMCVCAKQVGNANKRTNSKTQKSVKEKLWTNLKYTKINIIYMDNACLHRMGRELKINKAKYIRPNDIFIVYGDRLTYNYNHFFVSSFYIFRVLLISHWIARYACMCVSEWVRVFFCRFRNRCLIENHQQINNNFNHTNRSGDSRVRFKVDLTIA